MIAVTIPPNTLSQPAMPLSMATRGETVVIRQIQGQPKLRQRLIDLGLNQGAHIRIIKNEIPTPLIIAVKEDSRLALERSMTHHIMVTLVGHDIPSGGN